MSMKYLGNGVVQLHFANREEGTPEAAYALLLSHMHLKDENGEEIDDIDFKKHLLDTMINTSEINIYDDSSPPTSPIA